jgi:hypothetical protein
MRLVVRLIIVLFALLTAAVDFDLPGGAQAVKASVIQSESKPKIMNARLSGKKLIVTGENFASDAVVSVNGVKQKTKNDSDNPTTMLIAKKAGKKIPDDAVISIQVLNAAGSSSETFGFFSGRSVTIDDGGKTIELKVGERILLILKDDGFEWEARVEDSTVLKKLSDVEVIPGAQGIFEAQRAGQTKLLGQGDPPCLKLIPACKAPSVLYEFNILVR